MQWQLRGLRMCKKQKTMKGQNPKFPDYPEIFIFKKEDVLSLSTTFRFKRKGKWYDLPVLQEYLVKTNDQDSFVKRFKDGLMERNLFFKPDNFLEPSKNQQDTIYPEFEDVNWQNRIKKNIGRLI